jgi:hypothetical protein
MYLTNSRSVMAILLHELWLEEDNEQTFCLAGPMGDSARALLSPNAKLVWTVEAGSHFEAMTKYYKYMNLGLYKTNQDWDKKPYPDEWLLIQTKK